MRRRLSSNQTILIKIILPVFWIPFFGMGAVASFSWGDKGTLLPWMFLVFWLGGSALLLFDGVRLKFVMVDDEFLYASNYLREIAIPLWDIYDVTENFWLNIHPVTVHLKHPSEFGDKIVFMPKTRFWVFASHPVVKELKQLARSKQ